MVGLTKYRALTPAREVCIRAAMISRSKDNQLPTVLITDDHFSHFFWFQLLKYTDLLLFFVL